MRQRRCVGLRSLGIVEACVGYVFCGRVDDLELIGMMKGDIVFHGLALGV